MASKEAIEKIPEQLRKEFEGDTFRYPIPKIGGFAVSSESGVVSNHEPDIKEVYVPVEKIDGLAVYVVGGAASSSHSRKVST